MSWNNRLRPEINFTSPSGNTYTALWKGDDISASKRLGRHAYPNLDKEIVQDLGMNSRDMPLTIYFDGADNDKNACDFEKALYEPGVWRITHPVYGSLRLQLVSYKISVKPVDNGNVTVVETDWIEPADDEEVTATLDPEIAVKAAVENVNQASLDDMSAIVLETAAQNKSAATLCKQGCLTIKGISDSSSPKVVALQKKISHLSNEDFIDIVAISISYIDLIGNPELVKGSVSSKISTLANIANRVISSLPGIQSSVQNIKRIATNNASLIGQFLLNCIIAATGKAIISGAIETRREALSILNEYRRLANTAQAALDKEVELTTNSRIEHQFVARANSGEAISSLNASVAHYLLKAMFDLKIERRIQIDRPRSPKEIAITEYKANSGNADYYCDFFCKTNDLHGKDLLLLPSGYEVVIYA